jgi:hypothetical protein
MTLGTRDKNSAYKKLLDYEKAGPSDSPNSKKGPHLNVKTEKSVQRSEVISEYVAYIRSNMSGRTQKHCESIRRSLEKFFRPETPVGAILLRDIERFKADTYSKDEDQCGRKRHPCIYRMKHPPANCRHSMMTIRPLLPTCGFINCPANLPSCLPPSPMRRGAEREREHRRP